jgi:hypothetical protein
MLNRLTCASVQKGDRLLIAPGPFSWRVSKLAVVNPLKPQSFHPACRLFPPDSDISSRGQ